MEEKKLTRQEKIELIVKLRHDHKIRAKLAHQIARTIGQHLYYVKDVYENEGFDEKKKLDGEIKKWKKQFEEQLTELLDLVSGDFDHIEEDEPEGPEELQRWEMLDL